MIGHSIQKPAVVRHYEVGPSRAREVLLEKLDGLEVEVVRRLVEEQDVGRGEDRASEHRPVLLAARKLRERSREVSFLETEARESLVDLGDHFVAALVLEAVRQGVIAVVQGRAVLSVGHRMLELAHLGFGRMEVRECPGNVVVQRLGEVGLESLLDGRDPDGVRADDLTRVRLFATEGEAQKCGLPGAIPAQEADLLARVVLPGDVAEDLFGAVGLADAVEAIEHARDCSRL